VYWQCISDKHVCLIIKKNWHQLSFLSQKSFFFEMWEGRNVGWVFECTGSLVLDCYLLSKNPHWQTLFGGNPW
jgi:hypothetical protein